MPKKDEANKRREPPRKIRFRCKNGHTWTGGGLRFMNQVTARLVKCPQCKEPGQFDGMVDG